MFSGDQMNLQYGFACQNRARHFAVVLCVFALSGVCASASTITYTGQDIVSTTTSPHSNASTAAANFAAAAAGLGTVSTIDFESAPLGSFSSLSVAAGVTMTGTDLNGNDQTIRDTSNSPTIPTLDGFNTTPGGANFVEVEGGTLTFTFATPTQFFGAYFTGVQNFFTDYVTFSDGTTQVIDLPEAGTSGSVGAVDFVGFTDAGQSISSVTINAGNFEQGADFIGVDDVSYQSAPTPTPEPDSIVLVLTGCLGVAAGVRRRFSV
jgi:hypothetical protein